MVPGPPAANGRNNGKDQTIAIDAVSSEWVHGFAHGSANVSGWIQNGWFCGP